MNFRWIEVDAPGERWMRSAALCNDGTVYVPAAIAGEETMAFLCAGWDGISGVIDDGHLYLPARWLAESFPDTKETCDLIESRVLEHCGATQRATQPDTPTP